MKGPWGSGSRSRVKGRRMAKGVIYGGGIKGVIRLQMVIVIDLYIYVDASTFITDGTKVRPAGPSGEPRDPL